MALVIPTHAQIAIGLERYRRGERPWPVYASTWYVAFDDGEPVPLKYLYALAVDIPPSSVSTNQVKAAVRGLGLNIVDIDFWRERRQKDASRGRFKHGDKRTWEIALDAVVALGTARPQEVSEWIATRHDAYDKANLNADLAMLSVNSPSRTAYNQNIRPRRTDQGSEFDRLFKIGVGQGVRYEPYDPDQHGVWEIYPDSLAGNRNGMSIRLVVDPTVEGLKAVTEDAVTGGAFDANNVEDARQRVLMGIVRRQGQPAFRKALLEAYGTCAITGCGLPAVLEAAHVHPYKGNHTNVVSNGLLLRTDIHTLFDLRLISIDPDTLTVVVSPELDGTEYEALRDRKIRQPSEAVHRVSIDALAWHRSRCAW